MGWQLVTVMPSSEFRVEKVLDRRAVPNHIFRFLSRRIVHQKRSDVEKPLFPGYIFVDADDRWAEVKLIRGVFDFVRVGREIASVDRYLADLMKVADENDMISNVDVNHLPSKRLKPGDSIFVRVRGTVCSAQFQRYAKNDQALVILSGKFPAVVSESDVIGYDEENASLGSEPRTTGVS